MSKKCLKLQKNSVWAHYKGNRYNLGSDNPEFAFSAYDDKVATFFPSPQGIEEVVAHFLERGNLNQAQTQQIRERYKIADSRRKSPETEYAPKTKEISRVTIRDGYGKSAIEYWLSPSGYCWRVNMEEYKKAFREMSLSLQRTRTDAYEYMRYQTPLSSSQVLTILESRKETLEPEEYEKLLGFFSGVRDKIDQVYNQQQSFRSRSRF